MYHPADMSPTGEARDYDTVEGVAAYARTLDGLNELSRLRHEAGYVRRERLESFLILGRWSTDSNGNFSLAKVSRGDAGSLPPVVTHGELFRLLPGVRLECPVESDLPPARVVCTVCKKRWTVQNAYDVRVRRSTEVVPLKDWVGKTIGEMRRAYAERTDGVWFMQSDIQWRNDRLIDLSPLPDYPTLKANEKGWYPGQDRSSVREIDDEHVIEAGDDAFFNVQRFFHSKCHEEDLAAWYLKHFTDIFSGAGFKDFRLKPIPNRYCSCESCGPWFEASTPVGTFTVGWRKRVINIDWPDFGKDVRHLFKEENVTQGASNIHAYGAEKAKEYLGKILGFVTSSDVHES